MAANTTPIFLASSALAYVQVSTANANRDGTGTLGTVLAGGTNGTLVQRVRVKATVTTTGGMVRIFLSTDSGASKRLIAELDVDAITPSATLKTWEEEWVPADPLILKDATHILYASTHNAETFNVFALGGNY